MAQSSPECWVVNQICQLTVRSRTSTPKEDLEHTDDVDPRMDYSGMVHSARSPASASHLHCQRTPLVSEICHYPCHAHDTKTFRLRKKSYQKNAIALQRMIYTHLRPKHPVVRMIIWLKLCNAVSTLFWEESANKIEHCDIFESTNVIYQIVSRVCGDVDSPTA